LNNYIDNYMDIFLEALEAGESAADKERREAKEQGLPDHEIIEYNFKTIYNGTKIPYYLCRCGASEDEMVGWYQSLQDAQAKVKLAGQAHVKYATEADTRLAATDGRFAF
jgi:hypothetical protein